jgi:hypothetical protein
VFGDKTFFGDLQNPWYLATPLLMFHLVLSILLSTQHVKSLNLFPPLLLRAIQIQLVFLTLGQLLGILVTFQSGFDAVIGYWPIAIVYYFCGKNLIDQKRKYVVSVSIISLILLALTQLIILFVRQTLPAAELILLSIIFPCIYLGLVLTIIKHQRTSNLLKILGISLSLPLLATHALDYSNSFYMSENKIFGYKNTWTQSEYAAATWAISQFKGILKETTAVGAIEDTNNELQTALLRASTRSFVSCGLPWSRFENFEQFQKTDTSNWPDQIVMGSYREISDTEFSKVFDGIRSVQRSEFLVNEQMVYWALIKK